MRADADESYLRIIHQPALSMIAITAVFGPPSPVCRRQQVLPGRGCRQRQVSSMVLFNFIPRNFCGRGILCIFCSSVVLRCIYQYAEVVYIYQYRLGFWRECAEINSSHDK